MTSSMAPSAAVSTVWILLRDHNVYPLGLEPMFPLWGRQTPELAREMIAGGLRAYLTCVDPKQLDAKFVGREFNQELLAELPEGVDHCGERGEFHSFVFAGPMFRRPIDVRVGELAERDGFQFVDVVPAI